MNRARTSAIVLLLASAAAAYEQEAGKRPEAAAPRPAGDQRWRRVLRSVLAWAKGRKRGLGATM
jgi:hypothetical protein